jgi:hypothetical protein
MSGYKELTIMEATGTMNSGNNGLWQYKAVRTSDLTENVLLETLNQEGASGWELAGIQALQEVATQEEGVLPGLSSHNLTGEYLLIFKKRQG